MQNIILAEDIGQAYTGIADRFSLRIRLLIESINAFLENLIDDI